MKKNTRIILLTGVCMLSVGIVLSVIGLIFGPSLQQVIDSGMWDKTFFVSHDYDNRHHQNNTYEIDADGIDDISIDWDSGEVVAQAYNGDKILLKEEKFDNEKIDGDSCLRYKVVDKTLSIDYVRNIASVSFSGENAYRKKLFIKIPKAMAENLSDFNFEAGTSNLKLNGLNIKNLTVDSELNLIGDNLTCENVSMSTNSGSLRVQFDKCPKHVDFESASGQCILILPKDSDFNLNHDSASGNLHSEFGTHGEHHHGNGEAASKFNIDTISGDVFIHKSKHH